MSGNGKEETLGFLEVIISETLQYVAEGNGPAEALDNCIWALARMSVEILDSELSEKEQTKATSELYREVIADRLRNRQERIEVKNPSLYAKPQLDGQHA